MTQGHKLFPFVFFFCLFGFPECILVGVCKHCTGMMTCTVYTACSVFSGNAWCRSITEPEKTLVAIAM